MPSHQLTLKIEPEMYERLEAGSRREGQTPAAFAKTLIEEGLRMEAHPEIVFHSGPVGRRPSLVDGMDIWQVAPLFDGKIDLSDEELREITTYAPGNCSACRPAAARRRRCHACECRVRRSLGTVAEELLRLLLSNG